MTVLIGRQPLNSQTDTLSLASCGDGPPAAAHVQLTHTQVRQYN